MNLLKISFIKSIARKTKTDFIILLLLFLIPGELASQTFHVQGNVSTDSTAVKYAAVNYVDQNGYTIKDSEIILAFIFYWVHYRFLLKFRRNTIYKPGFIFSFNGSINEIGEI